MPVARPPIAGDYLDKLVHLCEYLLFAWLVMQAIRSQRQPAGRDALLAWTWAAGYGGALELVQAMLPWRSAEAADIFANALGAWLGVLVGQRIPHQR